MDIKGRKRIGWRCMAGRTQGHLDTASSTRVRNLLERSTAQASLTRLPTLRILVLSTARSVLYSGQGVHSCCIPLSLIILSFFSACGDGSAGPRPLLKFNAKPALEGVPKSRYWEGKSTSELRMELLNNVTKLSFFVTRARRDSSVLDFVSGSSAGSLPGIWLGSMPHELSGDTPNRRTCAHPIRSA
jgi:hypothetical protein